MDYKIAFLPRARKDFEEWKKTDAKTVERIKVILRDIAKHPFTGIAKPEPLKNNLTGKWSRRINKSDRIIYSVNGYLIIVYIFSMKGHYHNK
ncbi:MAG: Txe/YoeB family addiction module toxin [Bacteroidales bacterium]|nr:Txe/YoeB family addiction module toxin [Bacteroidales bacterium]